MNATRIAPELPQFDLAQVLARVQKKLGWEQERLDAAHDGYLRYLMHCKEAGGAPYISSVDADEIWHTHILYTAEYANDCETYFGYFLHHSPCDDADEPEIGIEAMGNKKKEKDPCRSCRAKCRAVTPSGPRLEA